MQCIKVYRPPQLVYVLKSLVILCISYINNHIKSLSVYSFYSVVPHKEVPFIVASNDKHRGRVGPILLLSCGYTFAEPRTDRGSHVLGEMGVLLDRWARSFNVLKKLSITNHGIKQSFLINLYKTVQDISRESQAISLGPGYDPYPLFDKKTIYGSCRWGEVRVNPSDKFMFAFPGGNGDSTRTQKIKYCICKKKCGI